MRRFLLLFAICLSVSATAQDFKILFVNTGTIRIGDKDLSAGDIFSQSETIHWSDAKQAMKVMSVSDKKQFIFAATDFKDRKMKSAKEYLVKTNRLSTRGSKSLSSAVRKMDDPIYAIDTTMVAIDYDPKESEFFFVTDGDRRINLELRDGYLLLTPDIWADNESVEVDLYYHYSDGTEECIKDGLLIVTLPKEIKKNKRFRLF